MKKYLRLMVCVLILALAAPATVFAHEFIVKPVQLSADKDAVIPFSVVSAHVFMISEEMEPLDQTEAVFIEGGSSTPLKLHPNETLMTLDGRVTPKKDGTAVIAGHRKGVIWTQTTKGWKMGSKKGLEGVIKSGKYEKFCKTLLTVGKGGAGWEKALGQGLEIVPLSNPADLKPGDDLEVKILFKGKPFSPESVTATYDGFSMTPNTYAYFTEPYGEGLAKVKVTTPGVWMVRVQASEKGDGVNFDNHVLRSVLVFEVK